MLVQASGCALELCARQGVSTLEVPRASWLTPGGSRHARRSCSIAVSHRPMQLQLGAEDATRMVVEALRLSRGHNVDAYLQVLLQYQVSTLSHC